MTANAQGMYTLSITSRINPNVIFFINDVL